HGLRAGHRIADEAAAAQPPGAGAGMSAREDLLTPPERGRICPISSGVQHAYVGAMIEIHSTLPGMGDAMRHAMGQDKPKRSVFAAMRRGAKGRCPACGTGRLYERYLKVADHCPGCGEALHHHRADDAPPYFTIFAVGHIVLPVMLAVEAAYRPAIWLHVAV